MLPVNSVQNTDKWQENRGGIVCGVYVYCKRQKTVIDIKKLKLIMESCRKISRHLRIGH